MLICTVHWYLVVWTVVCMLICTLVSGGIDGDIYFGIYSRMDAGMKSGIHGFLYVQMINMKDMSLWNLSCAKFHLSDVPQFDATRSVVFILRPV